MKAMSELLNLLSEVSGESLCPEEVDDTFEIGANSFTLTWTMNESLFEIRLIDTHGNHGLGREVIASINTYAEMYDLEVVASNVRDGACGFWEKMGFQEGSGEGEYFLVA